MCERVFQNLDILQLIRATGTSILKNADLYEQSYNIGPQGYLPAIRYASSPENNNRQLDMLQWGYNTRFQQTITCVRAEEVHLKKTFKAIVNSRRCCVLIEGYYEWNSRREPFVFLNKKKELSEDGVPSHFLVAAIYTPDESLIILTREAIAASNGVHGRMPLLLEHEEVDMWINCKDYKYEEILKTKILSDEKEVFKTIFSYQIAPYVNDLKKKNSHVLTSFEEYKKEIKSDKPVTAFNTPRKVRNIGVIRCKTEVEGTLGTKIFQRREEQPKGRESKSVGKEERMSKGFIKIENTVFKTLSINRKENNDPIKVQIKNEFVNTTTKKDMKKDPKRFENDIENVDWSKRKTTSTLASKEEKEKLAIVLKSPSKNLDNVELDIEKGFEIKKVVVFVQKTDEDIEEVDAPYSQPRVMENRGFAVKLEEERSKKRKDYEEKDTNFVTELKKMKRTSLNPFLFKKEET